MITQPDCIFCQIVDGTMPCHKVWEDENYLAFLSIFPNTEAFTVVIPKEHFGSYAFAQSDEVLSGLTLAAKKVAQKIDAAYPDVGRTGLMYEGFGVDHLHAKLFPMHGTGEFAEDWQAIQSAIPEKYFDRYEGYMSSHNGKRADDSVLAQIATTIWETEA